MYSCVTCANVNGDPIGIASAARIRRIHYEEPPEPVRGRVQLCFPTPEAMRVTAMSHPDKELAAIILRTLVTTPKTVDREWMPIYEFLAHPNHFDLGFPGMFDTDLEWLTSQEWLPTSNISPGNKREILRSVEEFEGLDEHAKHGLLTCKARAFVKRDNDKLTSKPVLSRGWSQLSLLSRVLLWQNCNIERKSRSVTRFCLLLVRPSKIWRSGGRLFQPTSLLTRWTW